MALSRLRFHAGSLDDVCDLSSLNFDHFGEFSRRGRVSDLVQRGHASGEDGFTGNTGNIGCDATTQFHGHVSTGEEALKPLEPKLGKARLGRSWHPWHRWGAPV